MHHLHSSSSSSILPQIKLVNSSSSSSSGKASMEIEETKSRTPATLLLSLLFILHAVVYYIDLSTTSNYWLAFYSSVLPLAGILIAFAFLVLAARATMLTWITVLVLLAFSGKRRRVIAGRQGRKITVDVAMYVVNVVFRGKAFPAVVFATALSFLLISF